LGPAFFISTAGFQFKFFSDGITNKLVGVYTGNDKTDMILVRVYGNKTELMVDRQSEIRNILLMSETGLVPISRIFISARKFSDKFS
jgi:hypothetical protein